MKRFVVLVAALGACGDDNSKLTPDAAPAVTQCEVAIVGGGAGGLHTAFRLAPTLHEGVCLFEKETELGGRIHDVKKDDADPNSPVFGTGAMRVMEGQKVLEDLATELNITLQKPELEADFLNARGAWAFSKEDLRAKYSVPADQSGDTETAMYYQLGLQAARPTITDFADFRTYITSKVGAEGLQFLHDMSRFRADFEYPLDARGYMDYLDEEWDVCCTPSYPVGGMSQFIKGMAAQATTDGARIFLDEPVTRIDRDNGKYKLTTGKQTVIATKLVIAIPPNALNYVEGDLVDAIKSQQKFKEIIGVKVVTIAQWWPNRWWANLTNPSATQPLDNLWRAWSTEHCFNLIEMPLQQYAVDQNVTRSVYDDDRNCVDFWESLYNTGGTAAVETEIKRGLTHMFNSNTMAGGTPVTIPNPIKTHVQIWPAAWHWLRAGAQSTNAQLADWAVEPLAGEPVGLVGEAYNVQRSGWSDAAYKSSIKLLNAKYGMSLPLPRTAKGPPAFMRTGWHLRRN